MEINNELISSLALINSASVEVLHEVFQECSKTLTNGLRHDNTSQQSSGSVMHACMSVITHLIIGSDDKSLTRSILTFAITSLLLESAKNNVNESSLVRLLQEHKFDCSTNNFKLFIDFLHSTLPKVHHNISNLELNPLPKFRGMEWSQVLDMKSSSMESIKERTYLIDFYVDKDEERNNSDNPTPSHQMTESMILSQKELQDLHFTLRDCAKSLENFMSK